MSDSARHTIGVPVEAIRGYAEGGRERKIVGNHVVRDDGERDET